MEGVRGWSVGVLSGVRESRSKTPTSSPPRPKSTLLNAQSTTLSPLFGSLCPIGNWALALKLPISPTRAVQTCLGLCALFLPSLYHEAGSPSLERLISQHEQRHRAAEVRSLN